MKRDLSFLDKPEITSVTFYPRKQISKVLETSTIFSLSFNVAESILIVGRFYLAGKTNPTILFFHGNGEIAFDYDFIGPTYQQLGINLFVADYRGYGRSSGTPSFSYMLEDAHGIYNNLKRYLRENAYTGTISVMGRSLGSACAIELAATYQDEISHLIVESGFANTYQLLRRLGVSSKLLPSDKEIETSIIPIIQMVKQPLLIIHGEIDMIIPLKDGITLHRQAGSSIKEILIIPQAGHNDLLLRGPDDYMDAIQDLLFNKKS